MFLFYFFLTFAELNDSDDEYDEEGAEYLEMLSKQRVSIVFALLHSKHTPSSFLLIPM